MDYFHRNTGKTINGKIFYIVSAKVIKKHAASLTCLNGKDHAAVKPSRCWISGASSGSLLRWMRKLVSAAISRKR